jgi:A/G-specific adenine glycosylase
MPPTIQQTLCSWFEQNARDLPWRRQTTAYRVWISEIMLQQTRVEAVRAKYVAFMRRFPSVRKLAAADIEEVLQAWSGLGYYRRARLMHAAARRIAAVHGRIPRDIAAMQELPGIGRYTAGAIASIAFNQPEPIVDGNIERVFARWHCLKSPAKRAWHLADDWVKQGAAQGLPPRALNQALMELGATICKPRNPDCAACPARSVCKAFNAGDPSRYPAAAATKRKTVVRYLMLAASDGNGRILLRRRNQTDRTSLLPAGLWELPHAKLRGAHEHLRTVAEYTVCGRRKTVRHSIMDFSVHLVVQPAIATGEPRATCRWFTHVEAQQAAISSATRKALATLARPGR